MLEFLGAIGTVTGSKHLVLVHGDPGSAQVATRIDTKLGWAVSVPAYRDRVPIE